jgi:hypothetical protein
MLLGEILRPEAAHRRDERGGIAGQLEREAIGAPLESARHRVRQPAPSHRDRAGREQQQRQARHVVDSAEPGHAAIARSTCDAR